MKSLLEEVQCGAFEIIVNDEACIQKTNVKLPIWKIFINWLTRNPKRFKVEEEHKIIKLGNKLYVSQKLFDSLKEKGIYK